MFMNSFWTDFTGNKMRFCWNCPENMLRSFFGFEIANNKTNGNTLEIGMCFILVHVSDDNRKTDTRPNEMNWKGKQNTQIKKKEKKVVKKKALFLSSSVFEINGNDVDLDRWWRRRKWKILLFENARTHSSENVSKDIRSNEKKKKTFRLIRCVCAADTFEYLITLRLTLFYSLLSLSSCSLIAFKGCCSSRSLFSLSLSASKRQWETTKTICWCLMQWHLRCLRCHFISLLCFRSRFLSRLIHSKRKEKSIFQEEEHRAKDEKWLDDYWPKQEKFVSRNAIFATVALH